MKGRALTPSALEEACVSRIGIADSERKALPSRWLT